MIVAYHTDLVKTIKTNTKVIDEQIVKNANTQCFLPKYVLARCTSKFTSMLLCNTNALKRF